MRNLSERFMAEEVLKRKATAVLEEALKALLGTKTFIADTSFRSLLDVLACGIGGKAYFDSLEISRILLLESPLPRSSLLDSHVFLLLRPRPTNVLLLKELVLGSPQVKFTVAWVPTCTTQCDLEMERQGLKGLVDEINLPLYLLPCEENVWSLCRENDFLPLFIEKDYNLVTEVVKSLLEIGLTRSTYFHALGNVSESCKILFESIQSKVPPSNTTLPITFDQCVFIDRTEDPITLLVTPLHYEGLLDAVLGMNHGVVVNKGTKHMLTSQDEFYSTIRDLDFDHLATIKLPTIAIGLRDDKQTAPVTELASRIGSLVKTKQHLALHLELAGEITAASTHDHNAVKRCVEIEQSIMGLGKPRDIETMIEESLFRDPPLELSKMIKLLCLQALVLDGSEKKAFEQRQHQLCHTYGYKILPLLSVLTSSLQWLVPKGGNPDWKWSKLRKSMDLLKGQPIEDILNPQDIWGMFPTIGYAPLSVRRVQLAVGMKQLNSLQLPTGSSSNKLTAHQTILVYYVGGVTYAELAAYRYLNDSQTKFTFVVATTSICNTTRLLQGLMTTSV
ncbi:hypothetical protein THRCLA_02694 [Thraustotheca clavata]|uniref:Vacuolar protein sorting-associated protein n=1 Tax=Thraustotheca clavata TaxID=74557 RepID=A0A1W0A4G2_9STRA|nr:hypothetical protein THRCLA_02694 [Thraustotheca clavata]